MPTNPKLRVAICGGGIAGLTLAHALASPSIHIDIYEGAKLFGEIGAGIAIFSRPLRLMQSIGVKEDLDKLAGIQVPDGTPLLYIRADKGMLQTLSVTDRGGIMSLGRADLHGVLLDKMPQGIRLHVNKRLTTYSQPEDPTSPITLYFSDGTEAPCDVLIGADGVKSAVRATMLENLARAAEKAGNSAEAADLRAAVQPVYSGWTTYRHVVPAEKVRTAAPEHPGLSKAHLFFGKNHAMLSFPIDQGKQVNIAITNADLALAGAVLPEPWVAEVDASEATSMFPRSGWASEVCQIMDIIEGAQVKKWAINVVKPNPWIDGRVALVGDAAHAMTPFLGIGAGNAIDDVFVLREVLLHPATNVSNVSCALRIYADVRRPSALEMQEASRIMGLILSGQDKELLHDIQPAIAKASMGDAYEDMQRAKEMLEMALVTCN